jgi:long-chain acyl-CoA synthetase
MIYVNYSFSAKICHGEVMKSISLKETYKNRTILLLGGMGFLGGVLLAMFLQKIPEFERIYLVIRSKSVEKARERFMKMIHASPLFAPFRTQFGASLDAYLDARVTIVNGDVAEPDFGIQSESLLSELKKNVDLVINSAGLIEFNPNLIDAFRSNVMGAIHAAQFVKECEKGSLLHVSTCYVAGNISGNVPEALPAKRAPNGEFFDGAAEIRTLQEMIQNSPDKDVLKKAAIHRAKQWGWQNIYTYTKALAESVLAEEKGKIEFSVIRPSILESTLSFPFPGWNQGFNTSSPLIKFAETGFPFITARKDLIIDITPIDICAFHILKIGALLINRIHLPVYQSATSLRNPIEMSRLAIWTRRKQRKANSSWMKKLLFSINIRFVDEDHPLTCSNIYKQLSKIPTKVLRSSKRLRSLVKTFYLYSKGIELLTPFIYSNEYKFASQLIDAISVDDAGWDFSVDGIDWEDYWTRVHIPGIEKWCFSEI